jgi:hypothetical protein
MHTVEIPRDQWVEALDQFSKEHQGWIISMELVGIDVGDQIPVANLPLVGVAADVKNGEDRVAIMAGDEPEAHVTHFIESPKRVWIEKSDDPRHDAIAVEDREGHKFIVEFNHIDSDAPDRLLAGH